MPAMVASREAASQSPSPSTDTSPQMTEDLFASDEFRMFAYKILPCPKKTQHEWSTCPYSHPNEKARRRDPRIYSYLAIPCEATKQGGTCPRGDDCPNCHSLFEYWLHPSRYRTQLCRDMENGVCKRQVCFFAHSIEELRVPDHSHLNIPPEMQAAAAANNNNSSSNSSQSSDTPAANSNSSSGSSTPRAHSKHASTSSKSVASKLPSAASKGSGHSSSNSSRASSGRTSRASSNNSPVGQWAGHAGVPAGATAAAVMGNTNGTDRYYAALEHQRALMQLQLQAQGLAPSGGSNSFYEQQMQHMLKAAEYAQAQQQQQQQAAQLLMLQSQQAAAVYSAQLAHSSMGSLYGDSSNSMRRGSPPLSPMPSGLEGCSPPYGCSPTFGGSESRTIFVPPSVNNSMSSSIGGGFNGGGSGSMTGWQAGSLLRTLSTPANDCNSLASSLGNGGLIRHASSFAAVGSATHTSPQFASSGAGVGMQQMQHHSGGSSLADTQQDMTLASLLAGSCGGDATWGSASACAPAASVGMSPASMGFASGCFGGAGLGRQLSGQNIGHEVGMNAAAAAGLGSSLGGNMGGNAGMDMANLMLLQQQLQQKSALAGALDYLQQTGNNAGGQLGDCNNQAMGDMLGLMMQQLMLQQQSAVV